jgi:HEAT repeat protein/outer membrane protein assembly factor BamB
MMTGMRLRFALVAVAVGSGLVLAQEDENPRSFHIELDTHHLSDDVAKAVKLLESAPEDGVALAERLLRDPGIHEDLIETRTGVLASADHVLRGALERLPEASRKAYDARWDEDAARLEEQGTERALERLLSLYPGSSRAPRSALRLALLELEAGDVETASARLQELEGDAARVALPATYALFGRRRACGDALGRLEGDEETNARRLAARAAKEREASGEEAPSPAELGSVAWTFETSDWYALDPHALAPALTEPVCDAGVAYVQDQTRCVALDVETGKLIWRTALVEGTDFYVPPQSACRVVLGTSVVACPLPSSAIVALDRRSGERLATVTPEQLRTLAGGLDAATLVLDATLAGDVLVVALLAQEVTQDAFVFGFEARTGTLLWKVMLGHAPFETAGRPLPLLAHGAGLVFVAPAWGVLAAFEPRTGEVAWLRRYASVRTNARPVPIRRQRRAFMGVESPPMRAGFLGLVRGRLLLAAPDSKCVAAFEPRTGDPLHEIEDEGSPTVGVHGGRIVEVTREGIVEVAKVGFVMKARVRGIALPFPGVVVGDTLLLPRSGGGLWRTPLGRARDLEDEPLVEDAPKTPPAEVGLGPAHIAAWGSSVVATTQDGKTVGLGVPAPADGGDDFFDTASACRALGDPRSVVRERATRALGALGAKARAELELASFSSDPERAYRARALREKLLTDERRARFADAFSRSHGRRSASLLNDLVGRNPVKREQAVNTLSSPPDVALRPVFEELVADPAPNVALQAARRSFDLGSRVGLPLLTNELSSPIVMRRRLAMSELVQHGTVEDEDLFVKGLADEDQDVRNHALDGALAHGDARIAPVLVKAVVQGDDGLRRAVLQRLSVMIVNPGLAVPVLRILARDPDPAMRHRAVLVLGRHNHPEARAGLIEELGDARPEVRGAAYEGLRDRIVLEDPPDLPPGVMEKLLEHVPAERVVVVAARRMVDHGKVVRAGSLAGVALTAPEPLQQDALAALRRSVDIAPLDSRDLAAIGSLTRSAAAPAVRRSAYEALVVAHGPGRGALLARGLGDQDREVRDMVQERLPLAGAEALADLLALDEPGEAVEKVLDRADARVVALASLQALDSREERVRQRGLSRLRAIRATLEWLAREESDPEVARKLREALERSRP